MGCSVTGCQEGDELKTDPCTVCGKLVHHMCAIAVFEGAESALNESWEEALCNKTHASNAKDHAKLKHADHPLAILADQNLTRGTGGAVASTTPSPGATTGATTSGESGSRFFRATEKTLNVLISKFLVSQGLPYTLCASEPFKDVIHAATGNPSFAVLGRDKHDRLLN
ncbi:hypothetical protein PPTG_10980 [Phytophthora nicotianae INRA-310]|uniref:Uncharacterized protein n=1 Tax=Phytophthora nicotianae (strain INRA-310) TaxID=761204 RepID=W2QDJ8_PHYN3|nr:hypothetical protein PPTG_10980 [Phytophthora nicotianae INRA-310]ETN10330.1 hypothetical protein PPTG_10980 [Phytophthora nicotianae INRA-310]